MKGLKEGHLTYSVLLDSLTTYKHLSIAITVNCFINGRNYQFLKLLALVI